MAHQAIRTASIPCTAAAPRRGRWEIRAADARTVAGIPLPPRSAPPPARPVAGQGSRVVAAFLGATRGLSCEAAAELAGVHRDTLRRWRLRLPRALRRATSRRMQAHLAGTPPPAADAGFQRLFSRVLRSVADPGRGAPAEPRDDDGGMIPWPTTS